MSYIYRSHRKPGGTKRSVRPPRNKRSRGQYIDPAKFVKTATIADAVAYEPMHNFTDFKLHATLQQNLEAKGFSTPSPIQDQSIPTIMQGNDLIGIASTGTGKTAAFGLPVLHKLLNDKSSSALIIAPTRELAQQIEIECKSFAGIRLIDTALLIGGSNINGQFKQLRRRPQLVIGTPGRIKDHITRRTLNAAKFNIVVLDEVDRMLDMGFLPDVTTILKSTNPDRQSLFFSATLDTKINNLIHNFSHEPVVVSIAASTSSDNVHQDVVHFSDNTDRISKLHDILIKDDVSKVILFDETQRSVEKLAKELIARGFSADGIHGGKTQGQRQRALQRFKQNEITILVATDVAARGIDVADITHVINYSQPQTYDDYIHRIGRAGRAGQVGYALTFVAK